MFTFFVVAQKGKQWSENLQRNREVMFFPIISQNYHVKNVFKIQLMLTQLFFKHEENGNGNTNIKHKNVSLIFLI